MRELWAVDFFCGGGAVTIGLQQAGFRVLGVDWTPHPNYPGDEFVQADVRALPFRSGFLSRFDFLWASPPCQQHTWAASLEHRAKHPCFIPLVRHLFDGHPFTCIENLITAPLRRSLVLSGPPMGCPYIVRKRAFELSFLCWQPPVVHSLPLAVWESGLGASITKSLGCKQHFYHRKLAGMSGTLTVPEAMDKLGIPSGYTFSKAEVGEAIPPAYSRYIGLEVIRQLEAA